MRSIWVTFSKEGIHFYPGADTNPATASGDEYDESDVTVTHLQPNENYEHGAGVHQRRPKGPSRHAQSVPKVTQLGSCWQPARRFLSASHVTGLNFCIFVLIVFHIVAFWDVLMLFRPPRG